MSDRVVRISLPGVSVSAEVPGLAAHVDLLPPLYRPPHPETELAGLLRLPAVAPSVSSSGPRARRHRLLVCLSLGGVHLESEQPGLSVVVLILLCVLPHNHHGISLLVNLVPFLHIFLVIDSLFFSRRFVFIFHLRHVSGIEIIIYHNFVLCLCCIQSRHPFLNLRISPIPSFWFQI